MPSPICSNFSKQSTLLEPHDGYSSTFSWPGPATAISFSHSLSCSCSCSRSAFDAFDFPFLLLVEVIVEKKRTRNKITSGSDLGLYLLLLGLFGIWLVWSFHLYIHCRDRFRPGLLFTAHALFFFFTFFLYKPFSSFQMINCLVILIQKKKIGYK